MGRPQRTYLVLMFLTLVSIGAQHDKPKGGKHNIGMGILNAGVVLFLLYMGGFFN